MSKMNTRVIIVVALVIGLILGFTSGSYITQAKIKDTGGELTGGIGDTRLSIELEKEIENLQRQINEIQAVAWLEPFPKPDWDSGWFTINLEVSNAAVFNHGLDTQELFVYLIGKDDDGGVHQRVIGGDTHQTPSWYLVSGGASWRLRNDNEIVVYRGLEDLIYNELRVLIWKIHG